MAIRRYVDEKQERFANEYIIDFNGKSAAIRAGHSEASAANVACGLLKQENIQQFIAELIQNRSIRTNIRQDRILEEYAKIAFFNIQDMYSETGNILDINDLDSDTAAAIISLDIETSRDNSDARTKKVRVSDKRAALDSLARHLGMFNDKLSLGGQAGNPIETIDTSALSNEQLAALRVLANAPKTDTGKPETD